VPSIPRGPDSGLGSLGVVTRSPAPPVCLARTMNEIAVAGTTWVVTELAGVETPEPRPELAFGTDGRLAGRVGVNRIMGAYELHGSALVVRNAATTRMAGPPEAMEREQRLLEILGRAPRLVAHGDRLDLGDGAAILVRRLDEPDADGSGRTGGGDDLVG
jgi:heat shock protein HslJ